MPEPLRPKVYAANDGTACPTCGCTNPSQCHYDAARGPKQDTQEAAGELCCGWYATGKLDGPWTCPTCQRFYPA
jgi:hypothetical protein